MIEQLKIFIRDFEYGEIKELTKENQLKGITNFDLDNNPSVNTSFSKQGDLLSLVSKDNTQLKIYTLEPQCQQQLTIPMPLEVHTVSFSPGGTILAVKLQTNTDEHNFLLYHLNGMKVATLAYSDRVYDLDAKHCTVEFVFEKYAFIKNGFTFTALILEENYFQVLMQCNIDNLYAVRAQGYTVQNRLVAYAVILNCNPKARETDTGQLSIYSSDDQFQVALVEETHQATSNYVIKFDPSSPRVLVSVIHSSSTKSYYGESRLHYIDILERRHCDVRTPKGMVHAFEWVVTPAFTKSLEELKKPLKEQVQADYSTPADAQNGFIVVVGTMPSYTILYDSTQTPVFELCKLHRNMLVLSPNHRYMLVGGFGNLPCDYEYYDLKYMKLLSKGKVRDTTHIEVSDLGYIAFMSCYPRMQVDFFIQINDMFGNKLMRNDYRRLYEAKFVPNIYKEITYSQSDIAQFEANMKVEPEKTGNSLSGIIRKSDKPKPDTFCELRSCRGTWGNEVMPSNGVGTVQNHYATVRKPVPTDAAKKISTLQRKMNEVKTLKEKQIQGFFLNQSQLDKILKEEEFRQELESLEAMYK